MLGAAVRMLLVSSRVSLKTERAANRIGIPNVTGVTVLARLFADASGGSNSPTGRRLRQ